MSNLTTIVNVFQNSYSNRSKTNGIGDFIRGCYCLLGISDKLNVSFNACINHPINKFLKFDSTACVEQSNLTNAIWFDESNNPKVTFYCNADSEILETISYSGEFIKTLLAMPKYNNTLLLCNNAFPIFPATAQHKRYMRQLLEPTMEMSIKLIDVLNVLNIHPQGFIVIQVRCGDDGLLNNSIPTNAYILNLLQKIKEIDEVKNGQNVLLISDNNAIKLQIINVFRNFKTIFHQILHFGEHFSDGAKQSDTDVQNNMVEFYLLSKAIKIYSFSTYPHGSGFSRWCAYTYDIPYSCKLILKDTIAPPTYVPETLLKRLNFFR